MTYKLISQKYDQECTEGILQLREDSATRGNSRKIFKTRARLNLRKNAFSNRVVNNWNVLPEWVVNAETVEMFESRLDKEWNGQELKYNYRANIATTRGQHQNSQAIELELQALPLPEGHL